MDELDEAAKYKKEDKKLKMAISGNPSNQIISSRTNSTPQSSSYRYEEK